MVTTATAPCMGTPAESGTKPVPANSRRKSRDLSVEAIRIIAALFVISLHSQLPSVIDGNVIESRVFYNMLVGDAVAIFWMVSGFFMFGEKSYSKMLKKAVTKNIIPTVVILLLTFACFDFLNGTFPTVQATLDTKSPEQWRDAVNMLLYWTINPPDGKCPPGSNILWFLMVYALLMVIWPVLNAFAMRYLKGSNRNQVIFLVISVALLTWNELTDNKALDFSLNTVNALIPSAIFVLWGHIVYQHQDLFVHRKWTGLVALVVFIILALVRTFFAVPAMEASETHSTLIAWWHTPWGMLGATSVVIACFSFFPQSSDKAYAKVIGAVGGATMMIYLTHVLVQQFLWGRLGNVPKQFFYPDGGELLANGSLNYFCYMAVTVGEIFLVALAVSLLWGWLVKFAKFAWSKVPKRDRTPREMGADDIGFASSRNEKANVKRRREHDDGHSVVMEESLTEEIIAIIPRTAATAAETVARPAMGSVNLANGRQNAVPSGSAGRQSRGGTGNQTRKPLVIPVDAVERSRRG